MKRYRVFVLLVLFFVQPIAQADNWFNRQLKAAGKVIGLKDKTTLKQSEQGTARASQRSLVRAVQQALSDNGYNVGVVDGLYGGNTADAIRTYQRYNGLAVDGQISDRLTTSLGIPSSNHSYQSDELISKQNQDIGIATTIGAVGGAILGSKAADKLDSDRQAGAAAGALVVGALGNQFGRVTANKREDYARQHATVNQDITRSNQEISNLTQQVDVVESRLLDRNKAIRTLNIKYRQGQDVLEESTQVLSELNSEISRNSALAKEARVGIKMANQDIQSLNASIPQQTAPADLIALRDQRAIERDNLLTALKRMNGIESELLAQRRSVQTLGEG